MLKKQNLFYWILGFIFVLGIFFRTIGIGYRDCFEDDECRLILAFINKNWFEIFLSIGDAQSAPPIFILIGKILGNISGYSEKILKLIPYVCSIVSIFVFDKLAGKIYETKYCRLLADLLFAVNMKLIVFASIFKQYSSDVLVGMLCLLFLPKVKVEELNLKRILILGLVVILLPYISLPALFFIGAFFVLNIKNWKKLLPIVIPFVVSMVCYYCFNLYPSKLSLDEQFPNYWDVGFVSFKNIFTILVINFRYIFNPNSFALYGLILFTIGIWSISRSRNKTGMYMLGVLIWVVIASVLHLYPLYNRVALYIIPMVILIMIKPLEYYKSNKMFLFLLIILFIATFSSYNFSYFKDLLREKTYIAYSPRKLVNILERKYNIGTDVILCNGASSSSLIYYAAKEGFNDIFYEIPYGIKDKVYLDEYFTELSSDKRYWFVLVKDYKSAPIFQYIFDWSNREEIIEKYQDRESYLLLVKRRV